MYYKEISSGLESYLEGYLEELYNPFSNCLKNEFWLRYLGIDIKVPPNVKITYQGTGEFSNFYVWSFNHSAENLGFGENRLGRTKIVPVQEGKYILHIEIPTEDIISEVFKTNDKTLIKTIKYGIGGHEETHACIMSGNLTKFYKLLLKHGVNEISEKHLNFAKEFDKKVQEAFKDRKEEKKLSLKENYQHALCYLGSLIALKKKKIPPEYIDKFFEF